MPGIMMSSRTRLGTAWLAPVAGLLRQNCKLDFVVVGQRPADGDIGRHRRRSAAAGASVGSIKVSHHASGARVGPSASVGRLEVRDLDICQTGANAAC